MLSQARFDLSAAAHGGLVFLFTWEVDFGEVKGLHENTWFLILSVINLHTAGDFLESTPWFETYKAEFFRTLLFNDHETFDHPLACESSCHIILRITCRMFPHLLFHDHETFEPLDCAS